MRTPSASEMNPSDDAIAAFGRAALGSLLSLVLGTGVSMAVLLIPGRWSEVASAFGFGLGIGALMALVVAPVTGFLAAMAHPWMARSLRGTLVSAVLVWLCWMVLLMAVGWARLGMNPFSTDGLRLYLPLMVISLAGALRTGLALHRRSRASTSQPSTSVRKSRTSRSSSATTQ